MHIQTLSDLDHDLSLFDDEQEFRLCWSCGQPVDRHGITMTDEGCDCCKEDV